MTVDAPEPLRVALVARHQLPYPYSRHQLDYPVVSALARRCARLDLVAEAADGVERTWREGPLVVHYGPRTSGRLRAARFVAWASRTLVRLHREGGLDVVNGSDPAGAIAGLLARPVTRTGIVVQLQDQFFAPSALLLGSAARRVRRAVATALVRRADVVRVLFQSEARLAIAAGADPERVHVVPSRCDPQLYDPSRLAIDPEPGHVLYAGGLIRRKGVDLLLQAAARVAARAIPLRVSIAGAGPEEAALVALAAQLGIADRVRFLGHVAHAELPALLASASVFVLPSYSEGTPRVILEAMSMERPVVATDVGGIAEMVEDRVHGRIVPPGSVDALVDALAEVLSAPAWVATAGALGRARVIERYSVSRHVDAMDALHRRAASGPTSARVSSVLTRMPT